jgi:predicted Zn-dependent peptidase
MFAQLDRTKKPLPGPAPVINLGDYELFELPNGLKVIVVENHKLPKVNFRFIVNREPLLEKELAGYINTTGELLGTGTKTKNKAQIDEEVDFIGATLSTSATSVNGSCLSKNTEKLFEIMSDIIVNSEFKQEELDKIKTQAISGLASVKDDPKGISDRVKKVVLYGKDHPYGELETEQSINAITLELVQIIIKLTLYPIFLIWQLLVILLLTKQNNWLQNT